MTQKELKAIREVVNTALKEDIGSGDITSNTLIHKGQTGEGVIFAKEEGILAGIQIAKEVYKQVDPGISFTFLKRDGEKVKPKEKVARIKGKLRSILSGERTALNFLQSLSGIATLTSEFVKKTRGTKAQILDTRKTAPGLRILEKYAVRQGGGKNHRMGLYDMILIKDNHIQAAGGISSAIARAVRMKTGLKIEIETRNLKELKEALNFKVDRIMLDNFKVKELRKAVKLIRSKNKKAEIEASGNVNLRNVRKIASSGVDFISVGALTHSAKAMDFSLLLK